MFQREWFDEDSSEEFGTEEDEEEAPDWVYLTAKRAAHEYTLLEAQREARRKARGPRNWFLLSWFLKKDEK